MRIYLAAAAALFCGVLASGQQGPDRASASRPATQLRQGYAGQGAPAASRPAKAKLEFRLAALRSGREGKPLLEETKARAYIQRLAEQGPAKASDGACGWFEIAPPDPARPVPAPAVEMPSQLVTGKWTDKTYVLLSNAPEQVLSIDANRPYLSSLFPTRDEHSRPAIGFRLTTQGSEAMKRLTPGGSGSYVATVINDQVHAAPAVRGGVYDAGVIEGDFTNDQVAELIRSLSPAIARSQTQPAK